jgi:hypothetical protein
MVHAVRADIGKLVRIANVQEVNNFFLADIAIGIFFGQVHLENLLEFRGLTRAVVSFDHQVFIVVDDTEIANRVVWTREFVPSQNADKFFADKIELVNAQRAGGIAQNGSLEHRVQFGFARIDRQALVAFGTTEVRT